MNKEIRSDAEEEDGGASPNTTAEETVVESNEEANTSEENIAQSRSKKRFAEKPEGQKRKKRRKELSSSYAISSGTALHQFASEISHPTPESIFVELMSAYNAVMRDLPSEKSRYRVMAGIALTKCDDIDFFKIICIGTGTMCINHAQEGMCEDNINDCHAEVIVCRCLKDYFYTNLEMMFEGKDDESIFIKKENGGFLLKQNLKMNLLVSIAPCGDARIFSLCDKRNDNVNCHPNRNSRGVLRIKVKEGEGTVPVKGSRSVEAWDNLFDQNKYLNMSCSDKIMAWNVLGLQGALLSLLVTQPIYLNSIIVGDLCDAYHLHRAIFGRIEDYVKNLPSSYRLNKPDIFIISSKNKRQDIRSTKSSMNWSDGALEPEILNSCTGKTEAGNTSRLSKRRFFERFMRLYEKVSPSDAPHPLSYGAFKECAKDYKNAKKCLEKAAVAAGLGQWVKKPSNLHEFKLT